MRFIVVLPFWVERDSLVCAPPEFVATVNLQPSHGTATYDDQEGTYETGLMLRPYSDDTSGDVVVLGDSHSLMFFPAIYDSCSSALKAP